MAALSDAGLLCDPCGGMSDQGLEAFSCGMFDQQGRRRTEPEDRVRGEGQAGRPTRTRMCVCRGGGMVGKGGPALRDIPASNRSAESDSKKTTPELRKENNKRA